MRKTNECECNMRGLLSFLLLFFLSQHKMTGAKISDEIEKRKGCRLSPGTLYPALKSLRENGFISEKKQGRNCIYAITSNGKRAFKVARKKFITEFSGVV